MVLRSPEAYERSLVDRVRLNYAILSNDYWKLPVDNVGHESYVPVGRGVPTSPLCGSWRHFVVCDNVEGHKGAVVGGVDYTGKLVVAHQHLWCGSASCPVCFIRGWAVRVARSVAGRLEVASERGFGKDEHLTVSVPPEDYGLPEAVLRDKCRRALFDRGFLGGAMVFHGYRKDRVRKVLVWAPHYHALGFIRGGMDVCRQCVHDRGDCAFCEFFKGREVRGYAKDRYIVKCLSERKTVVGTLFYQLHHATLHVGLRRFHVVTWCGCCGNRKLKGRKKVVEVVCPACGDEMVKKFYVGKVPIVKDLGSPLYLKVFPFDEVDAFGRSNFVDVVGGRVE